MYNLPRQKYFIATDSKEYIAHEIGQVIIIPREIGICSEDGRTLHIDLDEKWVSENESGAKELDLDRLPMQIVEFCMNRDNPRRVDFWGRDIYTDKIVLHYVLSRQSHKGNVSYLLNSNFLDTMQLWASIGEPDIIQFCDYAPTALLLAKEHKELYDYLIKREYFMDYEGLDDIPD